VHVGVPWWGSMPSAFTAWRATMRRARFGAGGGFFAGLSSLRRQRGDRGALWRAQGLGNGLHLLAHLSTETGGKRRERQGNGGAVRRAGGSTAARIKAACERGHGCMEQGAWWRAGGRLSSPPLFLASRPSLLSSFSLSLRSTLGP